MAISTFGGQDAIESSKSLNDDLQKDRLLKLDVGSLVRQLTPYIPALGLLYGGDITSNMCITKLTRRQAAQASKTRPTMRKRG